MLNLILNSNKSHASSVSIEDIGGYTGFQINGVAAPFEYGMKALDGQMIDKSSASHIKHMDRVTLAECHNCFLVSVAPHAIDTFPSDQMLADWQDLDVCLPLYGTFPISAHVADFKWDFPVAEGITITQKPESSGYTAAITIRRELTKMVEDFDPHAFCVVDTSFLSVDRLPVADVDACVKYRELALDCWDDLPFRKVGIVRNPSLDEDAGDWAYVVRVHEAEHGRFRSIFDGALTIREPSWALVPEGHYSPYALVVIPGSSKGKGLIPNNIIGGCNSRLARHNWREAYGDDWVSIAHKQTPLFWFNAPVNKEGIKDLTTRAASAVLEMEGLTYLLVLRVFKKGAANRYVLCDYEVHNAPLGWEVADDTKYLVESATSAIPSDIKKLLAAGNDPYRIAEAMLQSLVAHTGIPGTDIESSAPATLAYLNV